MSRPPGWRLVLWRRAWWLATWLAERRRPRPATPTDVEKHVFRHQTRGMGLRMTEHLRDEMRPRWLRVVRENE